jgi:hypothetical protein
LAPVLDQRSDRPNFQTLFLGKAKEVIPPGHRSIVIHDFADDTGRAKTRQTAKVNRRLRMSRPNQDAPLLGLQGKDMSGHHKILRASLRVAQDLDGSGTIRVFKSGRATDAYELLLTQAKDALGMVIDWSDVNGPPEP